MENTFNPDNAQEFNDLQLAGFGLRLVAILIDGLIILLVAFLLFGATIPALMPKLSEMHGFSDGTIMSLVLVYFFGIPLFFIVYQAAFEASSLQGTPGKKAVGIKVTDMQGVRISFLRAAGRNAAKMISGTILCIGYLMALWTKKKQGLHDMIASTLVIKKN